jgi:predicted transcriptional regulator
MQKEMTERGILEVVFDILDHAERESFEGHYEDDDHHHRGAVVQTEIMYKGLHSYNQLQVYLKVLTENDLLSFDSATRKFKITQKGHRFVQLYNKMNDLVKEGQEQQI